VIRKAQVHIFLYHNLYQCRRSWGCSRTP